MKIIQVTAVSTTVEAFLLPLIERLSQRGHEISVIACDAMEQLNKNEIIKKNKVALYQAPIPRSLSPVKLLKAYTALVQLFRDIKPDVVHTHTPVASLLARKAATKARVPTIIYTCHGFYFHENMPTFKKALFSWLEKRAAQKNTDYIFTVNREDLEYALENNFIEKERIININSVGINTKDKFNPSLITSDDKDGLRHELKLEKNEKVITFIGRIVAEKGIIELIKAFSILRAFRDDIKLIIVGETLQSDRDKKTKEIIKHIIEQYHLERAVIFTGFRKDTAKILSISDVFVLPSHREGMPVSSLEAMSMGVPVVGTNIRGLREEIVEGKTGYIIPLNHPEKLAEGIEKALNSFNVPDELCRKHVVDNFDEVKVLERQLRVYADITF